MRWEAFQRRRSDGQERAEKVGRGGILVGSTAYTKGLRRWVSYGCQETEAGLGRVEITKTVEPLK